MDDWNVSASEYGYRLGAGAMRPTSRGNVRLDVPFDQCPSDITEASPPAAIE